MESLNKAKLKFRLQYLQELTEKYRREMKVKDVSFEDLAETIFCVIKCNEALIGLCFECLEVEE